MFTHECFIDNRAMVSLFDKSNKMKNSYNKVSREASQIQSLELTFVAFSRSTADVSESSRLFETNQKVALLLQLESESDDQPPASVMRR